MHQTKSLLTKLKPKFLNLEMEVAVPRTLIQDEMNQIKNSGREQTKLVFCSSLDVRVQMSKL